MSVLSRGDDLIRDLAFGLACMAFLATVVAIAENEYELPPLNYSPTPPRDGVSRLRELLESDPTLLAGRDDKESLEKLLNVLNVPRESQLLVFSKTSLQRQRIHSSNPRAIYFSDADYVGWVPGGDMEITSFDPVLGATFYRVSRDSLNHRPMIKRDNDCLSCHAGSKTRGVPSPIVRSVFTDAQGEPILTAGSFHITHENPMSERWGGWYVTGSHGRDRHMGNSLAREIPGGAELDREAGANVLSLGKFFDVEGYPSKGSDIVALMVFEHQVGVQQRLLEANQNARFAIHRYESLMRELKEPVTGEPAGSALSVVKHQVEKVLAEMLLIREAPITGGGIQGDPAFVAAFQRNALRDGKGRSLKDLDCRSRLFRHRMSPLIYSSSFDGLPDPLREMFWKRLWSLLNEERSSEPYDVMTPSEKTAVMEILIATKKGLPPYWKLAGRRS